jgi:hypothetical protein
MNISTLISKIVVEQQSMNDISHIQAVLDLLSDEERSEIAKFIDTNISSADPEKIRQDKLSTATAAARAGMQPADKKPEPAPELTPAQRRAQKYQAAAAAAQATMRPKSKEDEKDRTKWRSNWDDETKAQWNKMEDERLRAEVAAAKAKPGFQQTAQDKLTIKKGAAKGINEQRKIVR